MPSLGNREFGQSFVDVRERTLVQIDFNSVLFGDSVCELEELLIDFLWENSLENIRTGACSLRGGLRDVHVVNRSCDVQEILNIAHSCSSEVLPSEHLILDTFVHLSQLNLVPEHIELQTNRLTVGILDIGVTVDVDRHILLNIFVLNLS